MTVRDFIKRSMKLAGIIADSENMSASEGADGLLSLNEFLASWSAESIMIPAIVRETFNLVAGQAAYTIGDGGDFDTSNPQLIEEAKLLVTSATPNFELPLKIYNVQEYSAITQKALQTDIPEALYFQRGEPLSTITLYSVPSGANKLALYSRKPLTEFTDLSEQIVLPKGYLRALRYNFAMELAGEYDKPISEYVAVTAPELKAQLARSNTEPVYMRSDVVGIPQGANKPFNIYTGE